MNVTRGLLRGAVALAIAASVVAPASATTLVRASLGDLVAGNGTIVVGEVVDAYSYWSEDGSFILTDVRVAATDVLKGNLRDKEFTLTIMGGRVGDITTLILGGAELMPGNSYVLFLNEENLPGAKGVRTVRDHCQGVFELTMARDGLRAVSQANRHPLVPDMLGYVDAEGGVEGFPLPAMMNSIRELVDRPQGIRREVQ